MPSTTSVGPTSSRRDDEPRTSPTKLTRPLEELSGVGTRPPARSWFELLDEPVEAASGSSSSVGDVGARGVRRGDRSGPNAAAEVAQQRRERPMRVGEQPARHGEPAALERDRRAGAPRRRSRHARRRRGRRAARRSGRSPPRRCEAASTTDSTGVDRAASMTRRDEHRGGLVRREGPVLDPEQRDRDPPQLERLGEAQRGADGGLERAGSATRSCPTATAWMTYGAGRSPP